MQSQNFSSIESIAQTSDGNDNSNLLQRKINIFYGRPKLKIFLLWVIAIIFLGLFSSVAFLYKFKTDSSKLLKPDSIGKDSQINDPVEINQDGSIKFSEYVNPINGSYLSKDNYENISNLKPVTVMINNHVLARPQAGISKADIIYEIVAEGGITRLLGVFYSSLPDKVGPVRSMRKYFQQVAAEYYPISTHWGIAYRPDFEKNLPEADFETLLASGGAESHPDSDARSYIDEIALPTLDQTALPLDVASTLFYKDTSLAVPTEHTAFIKLSSVHEEFLKVYPEPSWSDFQEFDQWFFIEKEDLNDYSSDVSTIGYNFWDVTDFQTMWEYNSELGNYTRAQGNNKTTDRNNNQPVYVQTLVIQKAVEHQLNDKKAHLLYDVIGAGDAVVYQNGKKILAKWSKSSARSRTKFTQISGDPVYFNRGLIWVTILPVDSTVSEN